MALTTKQRNALPASAFIDRRNRRFPVPTKAQARKAGISEAQRVRTHRNALARAAQQPRSSAAGKKTVTAGTARRYVARRHAGTVASISKTKTTRGTRRRR